MRALSASLPLLALAVLASACATAPNAGANPTVNPTVNTTRVGTTGGGTMQMNAMAVDANVELAVSGTVDQAWAVLPGVYAELKIPLSVNDPRGKQIGNTGWRTRRSIGGVPAQRYLDCGSSGTLENAETYQLNLSIVTTVRPNARGGSIVSTQISGTGRNPITSGAVEVRCVSKGDLERRIREMTEKAIVAPK